jgi:hypothetical protein
MKKLLTIFVAILVASVLITSCSNAEKELPKEVLTGNAWFVSQGNPNNTYSTVILLRFKGDDGSASSNTVKAWEGDGVTNSCVCKDGYYTINAARNEITISGLSNGNCPWMEDLNGTYAYHYDESRDGYLKYTFKKDNLEIRHLEDEK